MVQTRALNVEDTKSVAQLHARAFQNFFLSRLGVSFLRQFYRALVLRSDTICQGYWDANRLVGFFVANHSHKGFYKDLSRKNWLSFAMASFHVFLLNPLLLIRLVNSFKSNSHAVGVKDYPYLMSICVSPETQNSGLGKRMIQDLLDIASGRGFGGLYLTTDADDNVATNAFYKKNNFTLVEVVHQGKRKMNVYLRSLEKENK